LAERRNLVSARVPSHFKRSLPFVTLGKEEEEEEGLTQAEGV
jgi:hypothetical protein